MADLLVSTYEQPVPYMVGLEIQRSAEPDHLLLLEHEPVYTRGRRTKPEELPMGEDWYRSQGIDICDTDRGGAVTYHGPGQLVGYPIMRIGGVHEYVANLERVLIAALADEGVDAEVRGGLTGVWAPKGKIGSIGVHVSRGVTTHGFAVNVDNDLQPFEWVVPCGIEGAQMSSVCKETGESGRLPHFREAIIARFCEVFEREAQVVVSTAG
ncbi:MAG TPA: lipoyl(octanoyl) transferase LipB [Thermoleophilaceae bacterium]|nr:lipoyl(octanoyl) transferase LipB [Thermoleophilaceae bacterium]